MGPSRGHDAALFIDLLLLLSHHRTDSFLLFGVYTREWRRGIGVDASTPKSSQNQRQRRREHQESMTQGESASLLLLTGSKSIYKTESKVMSLADLHSIYVSFRESRVTLCAHLLFRCCPLTFFWNTFTLAHAHTHTHKHGHQLPHALCISASDKMKASARQKISCLHAGCACHLWPTRARHNCESRKFLFIHTKCRN